MAANGPRKQLALDTNVLFNLADGRDFAHAFREAFLAGGYALRFPPTVLEELVTAELELNDALILAETAVATIPLLVTSDRHLLDVDEDELVLLCGEADLCPVRAAHPRRLLHAIR